MKKTLTGALTQEYVEECQQRVISRLTQFLPETNEQPVARFYEAIHYSVLNGGKRLRPMLVYTTSHALKVDSQSADIIAAVVELIHTYSLIHDDLPAMDDSHLRRGFPTCHIAYDEAIAILVGDALQSLAFEILSSCKELRASDQQRVKMITVLAKAIGARGMIAGQVVDIDSANQKLSLGQLEAMYLKKTGMLLQTCIHLVTLLSENTNKLSVKNLLQFGEYIGLIFQLQDDVFDIEIDTEKMGKPQGLDLKRNKNTYPEIIGLEPTKQKIMQLHKQALDVLERCDINTLPLIKLANYILQRSY